MIVIIFPKLIYEFDRMSIDTQTKLFWNLIHNWCGAIAYSHSLELPSEQDRDQRHCLSFYNAQDNISQP
jgi:hypothetical protein